MTLKNARALRDYIHAKGSVNCSVPLGFGPDGYFATSRLRTGPHQWQSKQEFRNWQAKYLRDRRKALRDYEQMMRQQQRRRSPRSPIEMMVDRACGLV